MAKQQRRGRGRPPREDKEYINNDGYTMVRVPSPIKGVTGVYVQKHRLIMEEHLGRKLKKGERVYFKDGDKQNFDIDNLEIRFMPTHGIKIEDLECPHCGKRYKEPPAD